MTPKYTTVGAVRFGYRSCIFSVDNFPITGVMGVSAKQKRVRKTIASNVPGASPLGRTTGLYSAPVLTLRLLRESSEVFAAYLAERAGVQHIGSSGDYADAVFDFSAQCAENTNNFSTVTMRAGRCIVTDKATTYDQGVSALVDEYTIEALQVFESDARGVRNLYSTAPNALDGLAQDYVTIGSDKSPGRATILNLKREIGWDVRQAFGLDKATLIPKGNPPATFDIRFDLITEADYTAWKPFSAQYLKYATLRIPGSTADYALAINHPILQAQPICLQACVIAKINGLNKSEDGLWGSTIEFMEYGKPIIAKQAATAQISAASKTQPTAVTAADVKQQALELAVTNVANDRAQQVANGAQ